MFWADKVAKEIIDSGKFRPFWVDDMKTLSGFPTVGSLRGPLVHDLVFKALQYAGEDVTYTYIFNDFDPIDGLSDDLKKDFEKYMGFPLKLAPSPKEGFANFADYFADDFSKVLNELGMTAKYLSSWDMYHQGEFDGVIRLALDNAEKIQDIYQKVSGSKKKEIGWLPFQVICENCSKLGTTKVFTWDGEKVSYKCELTLVKWAQGCNFEGKISPFGGTGKLPWKVDWPAHWKVLGVTIEWAGKDHASAGGSRDIAVEICKEVFNFSEPFNLPYEFLLIGGKKMSTSKGLGLKARELTQILPAEVARFLFCRTDYKQQANFNPDQTMAIPDLFDEYDRCFRAYIDGSDEALARTFEMSQIGKLPKKEKTFLPRFRDVINYTQQATVNLQKKFEEIKGSSLNEEELHNLKEREKYAKIWLERFAPAEFRLSMDEKLPEEIKHLDEQQKSFLKAAINLIEKDLSADDLQFELFNLSKSLKIDAKKAFSAIYLSFIGKQFGPKAGAFLLQYPKEKVINRLKEAVDFEE